MPYNNLMLETADRIAVLTINRPEKLNALNHETLTELDRAFEAMAADGDVGVIIVTGAGEKSFVAGADIEELNRNDALSGQQFALFGQGVFSRIERMPKPVIAAVNGFALGGGCELAMACHMRTASENAKFGQPEVSLGIIPGYGGTQRLARLVGFGRAMELVTTGNMITAEEAMRIGLVNRMVPRGEAVNAAREIAKAVLTRSPVAVRLSIEAVNAVREMGQEEGLKTEAALFGLCCGSADFAEGTRAFLEKRPPLFTGK